jgi:hypothetical protein
VRDLAVVLGDRAHVAVRDVRIGMRVERRGQSLERSRREQVVVVEDQRARALRRVEPEVRGARARQRLARLATTDRHVARRRDVDAAPDASTTTHSSGRWSARRPLPPRRRGTAARACA